MLYDYYVSYFTPLGLWMHREPDVVMMFVTIMTEYGKMLALTSKHLIFRNKCDEYYIDKIDGSFRQQRLIDISITQRKGIFAPLTPNGRIIVNDIVASCYSDINEATLQTTYFSVLASLRKRLISWLGTWIDQSVDIPFGSEFSMELLRLVVPYIK
uniref:HintC domain-containing protein n=1 Tax=Heterorhabditis bacteriophora TaxID=37862 RepID=A0A1I7XC10_HETBA